MIESRVWLSVQAGGDASNFKSHLTLDSSHCGTQVTTNTMAE